MLAAEPAEAQTRISGSILGGVMEHRVDAGYGVAQARGPVEGGEIAVQRGARFALVVRGQVGTLTASGPGATDRDVAEVGVAASVVTVSWLALQGGVTRRSYSTVLARQRWTTVHVGAEARLPFGGSAVSGIVRGALLPVVSVNGLEGPDVAFTAAAGMEYGWERLVLGAFYSLERYDFPMQGAARRLEQLTAFTLRVGLRPRR